MITPSFSLTATERVLPRLVIDFTTATLDPRVTFTRSGNTATVVNSSGLIQTINADLPRFDFNPVTLVCLGLLIEESRTNIAVYSEDFSTSWSTSNATVSVNQTAAPDGNTTADKLVTSNAVSGGQVFLTPVFTYGVNNTVSVFAKAGEWGWLVLESRGTDGVGRLAAFDLTNGVTGFAGVNVTTSIQSYGNGWYRCTATRVLSAGASSSRFRIYSSNENPTSNSGPFSTGNGSSGIYIWGAQAEVGAFRTSYIPTVASQVTRTADVATMTSSNFSDWYSAGIGGVVARVLPSTVSGTRPVLQFDDATANEVITLRGSTTNPELVIIDGGATQAQIDAGTIAANTAYNLGAAWNTDNCAAAVDGGAAVTDTSATIPTVTQARLGSDGTNYLNGNLQTVRYWPQRIINEEVQAFSK